VTLQIGPATGADLAALREVLTRAWHDVYAPRVGVEAVNRLVREALDQACLRAQLTRDHVLVARDEGRIVLGCLFARLLPTRVEIARLYVDTHAKRRGVGRALIEHLAATAGDRPIELTVVADNLEARAFYQALGFQRIGARAFDFAGVSIPTLVLERTPTRT
jgi:ribosomal protein S18 acetylase RimI-like enzyme